MKKTTDVDESIKNANRLLDAVMAQLGLETDAALSRCLKVTPPVISKIRHGRTGVGASLLIALHETCDLSIAELKSFLTPSVPCKKRNA
jgi:plasmid maintenance system antidote protein VapI